MPMLRQTLLLVALLVAASGCAGDSEPETADDREESDATDANDEPTPTSPVTESEDEELASGDVDDATRSRPGATSPDLDVTVPDEAPEVASFEVVEVGEGPTVEPGDLILLAWEMLAIGTGEVVESTADDFGGPVPIEVGAGFVPIALDEALAGQTVGTRLDVQFPAGMADLPEYLDGDQAYVLAVQIVELVDLEETATDTTTPQTTTTVGDEAMFVSPNGPLAAAQPSGPAPTRNSSAVVSRGNGAELAEGDTAEIDYVVVSWATGQVVLSTADDFGGPQSIVLGDRDVPRILENAIFGQPVGSRIQVIYAPDLPDLHEGLDPADAYIVAVDIRTAN